MKKLISILILVCMLFCLCSCDALDDMKLHHGVINDDGSISLMGYKYINIDKLDKSIYDPLNAELYVMSGKHFNEYARITEKDVPALLSTQFGRYYSLSSDLTVLTYNSHMWYLRENTFNTLKEKYKDGINFNSFYIRDYQSEISDYSLNEQQYLMFENVENTTEPSDVGYDKLVNGDGMVNLCKGTIDGYFEVINYRLYKLNNEYYIGNQSTHNRYLLTGEAVEIAKQFFK